MKFTSGLRRDARQWIAQDSRLFAQAIQESVGAEIKSAVAEGGAGVEIAGVAFKFEVGQFRELVGAVKDEQAVKTSQGKDFVVGGHRGNVFAPAVVKAPVKMPIPV